jgi:hypothetical protein
MQHTTNQESDMARKITKSQRRKEAVESLHVACELAAAFIGMHTSGGVPARYVGRFNALLDDPNPKAALAVVLKAIAGIEAK